MKKSVIIPIAVIAGIAIVGILAAIVLNPVVYRRSFMLGNDKISVELCVKERQSYIFPDKVYNLRITRDSTTIVDEDFLYCEQSLKSKNVKILTGAEENMDVVILGVSGNEIYRVEILGDEINFFNNTF